MAATAPTSTSRAVARRRRRDSREQLIVAATRKLFEERGLQDARVDDIARAAGLNKALIYRALSSHDR
jgi:AcrR family transcriptional regulator